MRVAIYGRNTEENFLPCLKKLIGLLQQRQVEVICEETFALWLEREYGYVPGFAGRYGKDRMLGPEVDMLLSIGGDGTFLDSVLYAKDGGVPVLGVNGGRLGFLANVQAGEIGEAVEALVGRRYTTEERDVLQLKVNGQVMPGFDDALNEVCVLKTPTSSLLNIHASIGDVYLTTYWADGLIVATPTGSTAYSLSGGGPIVCPECRNILLTPVCPHNLSMRPLVVPNDAEIVLKVESRQGEYMLTTDSRMKVMADSGKLSIRTGNKKIRVVKLPGHNYYETLRNKLMWGEDKRNDERRF